MEVVEFITEIEQHFAIAVFRSRHAGCALRHHRRSHGTYSGALGGDQRKPLVQHITHQLATPTRLSTRSRNIVEKVIPAKLHVLTLTPFYPSDGDEVSGCFIAESLRELDAPRCRVVGHRSRFHLSCPPHRPTNFPPNGSAIRNCPETLVFRAQANFLGRFFSVESASFIGSRRSMSSTPTPRCPVGKLRHLFRAAWAFHLLLPFMVWMSSTVVSKMGLPHAGGGRLPWTSTERASKVICISDKVEDCS